MSDAVEDALSALTAEVTPDDAEREAMWDAVADLTDRATAAIDELGYEAEVLHVGSTARDTWLAGERDIDLFVRFPQSIDRETLTDRGMAIGRAVLEDGQANYAEHPYITGTYDGFDVDIVPCIDVDDASQAQTAVDRTPFHNAYVADRIDEERATEVRLAKYLLSEIDAYGSDLKTRGFGGYLLELLILEYGSVKEWLEAVSDWHPPVYLDPADHGQTEFTDPLVVIDPTDPNRNVAAVTSRTQFARVQHYARTFLDEPGSEAFSRRTHEPLSDVDLVDQLETRGSEAVALRFDRPDLLDDQLFPQLRKTRAGVCNELDRLGFEVIRSTILAGEDELVILAECGVDKLPSIERHDGPPVHIHEHATRFVETYADAAVYGPYIEDGRYVIERERAIRTPRAFLESDRLFEVKLGDQLQDTLAEEYDVLVDEEMTALLPAFAEELAAYFDPAP